MSIKHKTHVERRQFWQTAIEKWHSSGLSARSFGEREGLPKSAIYKWSKKLAKDEQAVAKPATPPFIEVTLPEAAGLSLELALTSGNILRIDAGTERLSDILAALCEAGLC